VTLRLLIAAGNDRSQPAAANRTFGAIAPRVGRKAVKFHNQQSLGNSDFGQMLRTFRFTSILRELRIFETVQKVIGSPIWRTKKSLTGN
jgi:hypothetical protein